MDSREYILARLEGAQFNSSGQIHTRCPFHADSSPSFSIREDGVFVCGSPKCGIKGSFPYFYKLMEGIESWAQVYKALKLVRVTPDLEDLFEEKSDGSKKYWISNFPVPPRVEPVNSIRYLVERGLGPEVVSRYGLLYGVSGDCAGISIRDTIVAPVFDLNGVYLTFQVRYLSGTSKQRWKMPAGSAAQSVLYGGWLIGPFTKYLWVVEGASDVWKLSSLGAQAVGLFTSKASAAQLNRLRDLCVIHGLIPVICMDGDARYVTKSGVSVDCGQKIFNEIQAFGLDPRLVHLEKTEDPGSLRPERFLEIHNDLEEGMVIPW